MSTQPAIFQEKTALAPPEKTIERDDLLEELRRDNTRSGDGYRVILYNDDHHDFDEVILQVQKATGCDLESAVIITMEAHMQGRAVCFRGARDECHRVARVLREIRLQCEVDCD